MRWHLLGAQCLNYFAVWCGRTAIFPVLSALENSADLHGKWSSKMTGEALAAGNIMHLLTSVLQSLFIDRLDGGLMAVVILFSAICANAMMTAADTCGNLIFAYALVRMASTPSWACQGKIVQRYYHPKEYDQAWSLILLSARAAMLITVSKVNSLLETVTWRQAMHLVCMAMFFALAFSTPRLLHDELRMLKRHALGKAGLKPSPEVELGEAGRQRGVSEEEEQEELLVPPAEESNGTGGTAKVGDGGAPPPPRSLRHKLGRVARCPSFWLVCINSILCNVLLEFMGFGKLFMTEKFHVREVVASWSPYAFLMGQSVALVTSSLVLRQQKAPKFGASCCSARRRSASWR